MVRFVAAEDRLANQKNLFPIAFFVPGIASHMIAKFLPVAGLVLIKELDRTYPLGAFPRVQLTDSIMSLCFQVAVNRSCPTDRAVMRGSA
jgi:hypothetical protein